MFIWKIIETRFNCYNLTIIRLLNITLLYRVLGTLPKNLKN